MKRFKAFTLIELLIVITIIGILSVALIPRITGGPSKARDAQRKTDLLQVATALEQYASDNQGAYPTQLGNISCFNSTTPSIGIVDDVLTYMTIVPSDPTDESLRNYCPDGDIVYYQTLNGYIMVTALENSNTKAENTYQEWGNVSLRFNAVKVSNPAKLVTTKVTMDANVNGKCSSAFSDCATDGAVYVLYK